MPLRTPPHKWLDQFGINPYYVDKRGLDQEFSGCSVSAFTFFNACAVLTNNQFLPLQTRRQREAGQCDGSWELEADSEPPVVRAPLGPPAMSRGQLTRH